MVRSVNVVLGWQIMAARAGMASIRGDLMAGQLCDGCEHYGERCYCSPNSTCEKYEPLKRLELEWNVYYHDFNGGDIKKFNIFDHWRFNEDVARALKRDLNRNDFARHLRSHLFYFFCSKCEYEVLISPWIDDKEEGVIKVDIFDQVMMNFDIFVDYVWGSKLK